ncbi:DUF7678 domain-containing protein [Desulfitobacterium chlororespirans]|uniref:DUF7678 domain-containing protein n=1 Tax=Desulfitobacterium chlororespirans DSM 11544 TaxID=1121395 RepID=A0A1M7UP58_9FIRM|nr:hypothetical protein [Desulfitobacterium chlororespirans]SHN84749.1 hypothetical protein SAMN02745215_04270 [Desulfitobacterium chlororespirans DSM 11544]
MHPIALKLIARFLVVPTFCVVALITPKDYNTAIYPQGYYKDYMYSAEVFEDPVPAGIKGGRVQTLKLYKNGKLIADFHSGWHMWPPKDVAEDFLAIAEMLDQSR